MPGFLRCESKLQKDETKKGYEAKLIQAKNQTY